MATKEEIREWLECCGAKPYQYIALRYDHDDKLVVWWLANIQLDAEKLVETGDRIPLHLLNPELTGVQGPTFAEWKKQKGREGKVEKVERCLKEHCGYVWGHSPELTLKAASLRTVAHKVLDAIEGDNG